MGFVTGVATSPTKGISEYPRMGSSLGRVIQTGLCLDTSQLNLGILLDVYFHCTPPLS